jgi:hypothetical protein
MDPSEWIARFRITHDRFKANILNEEQKKDYFGMREELARSLVAAQQLQTPEGSPARKVFRVAQVYKVEINKTYQGMTKMISPSGFSVALATEIRTGTKVQFAIALMRDTEPVTGEAKVVSAAKQGALWQLSFAIEHIGEANAERLEVALFDAVLARYK